MEENQPFSYRPKVAAKLIGVSLRTVHAWLSQGILKACRIGAGTRRSVLIPKSEIDRLLSVEPSSESKAR